MADVYTDDGMGAWFCENWARHPTLEAMLSDEAPEKVRAAFAATLKVVTQRSRNLPAASGLQQLAVKGTASRGW